MLEKGGAVVSEPLPPTDVTLDEETTDTMRVSWTPDPDSVQVREGNRRGRATCPGRHEKKALCFSDFVS